MKTKKVWRFDGAAFVRANAALVRRNQGLLSRMDGLSPVVRKDANLTAFLARQLVHERGRVEATIYERLRAAEFVPIEGGHPRGAASYSTQMLDEVGEAKISHDLAGDDPRIDVDVDEDLRKYVNVRASYAYSVQELEHAAMAGVPLPRWKADACANAIARKVDRIGRSGDAKAKLTGFFNNADVTVLTLTNGEWEAGGTTVAQIIADLQEIEATILANTKDTQAEFGGYTLVLPTVYEGILATTPRSDSSDMSIKEWFLKTARVITAIERYSALDSAVSPDIKATDAPQGICYPRDPSVLFWPFAITYEEQAPQLSGWEWAIRARSRVGGVDVRRASHMLYIENFD